MKFMAPHKRRTAQHVIADLAVHFVQGFILEEGHTFEEFRRDYGYDLMMTTFDAAGYAEPGRVYFQVKSTEKPAILADSIAYDIDIRDYNLWMIEQSLVILILYDARMRRAFWIDVVGYFIADFQHRPRRGAKQVRIRIPIEATLDRSAIREIRLQKIRRADQAGNIL